MRLFRGRLGSRPAFLLVLLLLTLMVARVAAQDLPPLPDSNDNSNDNSNKDNTDTATATATTDAAETTTAAETTATDATTTDATTTADPTATETKSDSMPTLPSLPTTKADYHYPPPTVPPTANAPYMQKSNVPEGTVFIAVGGILGLIGLSVLAWRALVAWSVNRSVRRAAMAHSQAETKTLLRPNKRKSTMYADGAGSTMSLEKLGGNNRNSFAPPKMPKTNSGLFYSPTAGAGMAASGNRASSYLPAGYYAAGMGPQSQGYTRTGSFGPSPPGSPALPPSRGNDGSYNGRLSHAGASTSSLNVNVPPQGRAPSAYLEDLFESHTPGPNQAPR